MGGTTTHGLPYPVGTDRVMDGDDAIKALAEAVDPHAFTARAGLIWTNFPWNTTGFTRFNAGGAADPAFPAIGGPTLAADGITVTAAGVYLVTGAVTFTPGAGSGAQRRGLAIGNAAGQFGHLQTIPPLQSNASGTQNVSGELLCAAGDVICLWRYTDANGSWTNTNGILHVVRVSP